MVNKKRLASSIIYCVIGVSILLWGCPILSYLFGVSCPTLFYLDPLPTSYNLGRFVWCLGISCIGFSALTVHFWRHDSSPYPLHVFYYPILLGIASALVFSGCHLFKASQGFVFYYLSAGLCMVMIFLIDKWWLLLSAYIEQRQR